MAHGARALRCATLWCVTPRQQDVAFVLEGVVGVVDVYAVTKPGVEFDYAVRLEPGKGKLAAAHYALLRTLEHEACRRVLFFEKELPASLGDAAVRLSLSAAAREESRARVPERGPGEPVPRKRVSSSSQFAVLLVGCSKELHRAVVSGLGVGARRVVESDPRVAAECALAEQFDLILCAKKVAFGPEGFLDLVQAGDPFVMARVILVVAPEERAPAIARLEFRRRYNTCLTTPIDPETLLEIATTGFVVLPWSMPVPSARGALAAQHEVRSGPVRVLIIDDDVEAAALDHPSSEGRFRLELASDAWMALDGLAAEPRPALVLCSASLFVGTRPLYRMLWEAHPELKPRFMLIASPHAASEIQPPSRRLLFERPLTRDRIEVALRQRALL